MMAEYVNLLVILIERADTDCEKLFKCALMIELLDLIEKEKSTSSSYYFQIDLWELRTLLYKELSSLNKQHQQLEQAIAFFADLDLSEQLAFIYLENWPQKFSLADNQSPSLEDFDRIIRKLFNKIDFKQHRLTTTNLIYKALHVYYDHVSSSSSDESSLLMSLIDVYSCYLDERRVLDVYMDLKKNEEKQKKKPAAKDNNNNNNANDNANDAKYSFEKLSKYFRRYFEGTISKQLNRPPPQPINDNNEDDQQQDDILNKKTSETFIITKTKNN